NSNATALALGADGSILTLGTHTSTSDTTATDVLLDRLTASGAQDPSFHDGEPLVLPLADRNNYALAERSDGSAVVTTSSGQMMNIAPSGAPSGDPAAIRSAGNGAPAALIPATDGRVLFSTDAGVTVSRFNLDGTISPVAAVPQFGGSIGF